MIELKTCNVGYIYIYIYIYIPFLVDCFVTVSLAGSLTILWEAFVEAFH